MPQDKLLTTISIALRYHEGQVDKQGRPYYQHLLRVAGAVPHAHVHVALLHDVFEDVLHLYTLPEIIDWLPTYFSYKEAEALYLLTHHPDVRYSDYIDTIEVSGNEAAIAVKTADLLDHLVDLPVESLRKRYETALAVLIGEYGETDT